MPAKTFFAMLEQGVKSKLVETSKFLFDLQDVVTFPHAERTWREQQRQFLWSRITQFDPKPKQMRKGMQVKQEDAAQALVAAFAIKAKVEGIHGRRTV